MRFEVALSQGFISKKKRLMDSAKGGRTEVQRGTTRGEHTSDFSILKVTLMISELRCVGLRETATSAGINCQV